MGKTELIEAVAEATGHPKTVVSDIANAIFDTTVETVRSGEDVSIPGFGTYSLKVTEGGREVTAPTGKKVITSESRTIKFRFSSARRRDF